MFHIHQYVKNGRGERIGVLLAFKKDEQNITIGWSKCCKLDRFDRGRALEIAIGRAVKGTSKHTTVPRAVLKKWAEFEDRAKRYFFNSKRKETASVSN